MHLKESAYNFIYDDLGKDQIVFYNSRTGALAVVHEDQYKQYKGFQEKGKEIEDQFVVLLIDGLLTKDINENGSNLSGGEKQKLSIVRALSKESFLILLDEPTSALDKDSIEKLMTLLKQRKTQAIILLVSHDQKVLEQCDEVIDISDLRGN